MPLPRRFSHTLLVLCLSLEGVCKLVVLRNLLLALSKALASDEQIDFDFRLGAGGADNEAAAVGKLKVQYVRAPERSLIHLAESDDGDAAVRIVSDALYLLSGNLGGRVGSQLCHEVCHLLQAVKSGHNKVEGFFLEIAVLLIERHDRVVQRHALIVVVRRHLSDHHGRSNGILISHIVAHHVAVALLKGENVVVAVRLFPLGNTLRHELEAGEGVLEMDSVCLADSSCHAGGDNGGQCTGVFGHGAGGLSRADDVVEKEYAHLVAGDGGICVAGAHHGADTVGVGVSADDEVVSDFLCKVNLFILNCLLITGILWRVSDNQSLVF